MDTSNDNANSYISSDPTGTNNVGVIDRGVRAIAVPGLIGQIFMVEGYVEDWNAYLALASIYAALTVICGWDLIYKYFAINTMTGIDARLVSNVFAIQRQNMPLYQEAAMRDVTTNSPEAANQADYKKQNSQQAA